MVATQVYRVRNLRYWADVLLGEGGLIPQELAELADDCRNSEYRNCSANFGLPAAVEALAWQAFYGV